ncbi:envelope biogenesis lipoprotein LpqN [Mycobacterium sp. HUMS_1102779]|uniref:LpqN/LpqT family lipoprotein n=1 Tax=Mycobacterium sp. HUMS_1102779 TaxID=3383487 RepID=UPI003899CFC5
MPKHFLVATISVAVILALAGCGPDHRAVGKRTSTSGATSTSTSTSMSTSTSTAGATPGAQAHKTIADYIRDNGITETAVHRGDPGCPTIDLAVPPGWQSSSGSAASYGSISLAHPADPADPPTISALLSKLTGDVDPAKILEYAPGELQNLPGYDGFGGGSASTLGGFRAWQLGGTYAKGGATRAVAQKTVVIPGRGAVFVLRITADALESDLEPLMDATSVIDKQTRITA